MSLLDKVKCLLCVACIVCLVSIAMFFEAARQAALELPSRIDDRAASVQSNLDAQLTAWRAVTDAQISGLRSDVRSISRRADARTAEALAVVRTGVADADLQLTGIRGDLNGQLLAANTTLATTAWPVGELARRYTLLPDQIAADRETKGLIAETMGVLGATKETMGSVAQASATFEARFPSLLDSASSTSQSFAGIARDTQRFTDRATAPCHFRCQVLEGLQFFATGVRAAGAAGVF